MPSSDRPISRKDSASAVGGIAGQQLPGFPESRRSDLQTAVLWIAKLGGFLAPRQSLSYDSVYWAYLGQSERTRGIMAVRVRSGQRERPGTIKQFATWFADCAGQKGDG